MARALQTREPHEKTRVVLLTRIGERALAQGNQDLKTDGYLSKPFKKSDILQNLASLYQAPASPGTKGEAQRRPAPNLVQDRKQPLHILIAEDNAVNQKLACRLLEKQGHSFKVASNGLEAVAAAQEETFDLILMDVQMPEMDGCQATKVIRSHETGSSRIPIIGLTAHAMKRDHEPCFEAGMDAVLTKPIQVAELWRTLSSFSKEQDQELCV